MKIKSSQFIKSGAKKEDFILSDKCEFAFVGRSNVGKSTLINNLLRRKNLAKTSSTPGRTQLVNYFLVNDEFYFVDLPGYGFHKAGKSMGDKWSYLIEDYLLSSTKLKRIFVLVDIRHAPSALDKQMVLFLSHYMIPFNIIATKQDKIKKSQLAKCIRTIAGELGVGDKNIIVAKGEFEDIWKEIEKDLNE